MLVAVYVSGYSVTILSLSLSSCATEGVPPYNGPTNHSIILPLEQEERVLPIPVGKLLCVNIIIK